MRVCTARRVQLDATFGLAVGVWIAWMRTASLAERAGVMVRWGSVTTSAAQLNEA